MHSEHEEVDAQQHLLAIMDEEQQTAEEHVLEGPPRNVTKSLGGVNPPQ